MVTYLCVVVVVLHSDSDVHLQLQDSCSRLAGVAASDRLGPGNEVHSNGSRGRQPQLVCPQHEWLLYSLALLTDAPRCGRDRESDLHCHAPLSDRQCKCLFLPHHRLCRGGTSCASTSSPRKRLKSPSASESPTYATVLTSSRLTLSVCTSSSE